VLPNGTAFIGTVELQDAGSYHFTETGTLGEQVAMPVSMVSLSGPCDPCPFNLSGSSGITFPQGNYTLTFQGRLQDFHLLLTYDQPTNVSITLPAGYNLTNPLLGSTSPGARVSVAGNETRVSWNQTRQAEIRFYDTGREELLYLFGQFWLILAVVMLLPYILTRRRRG
jgi:hypothetical protein